MAERASSRIARNTTVLTIASIAQKIISFGYFGYFSSVIGNEALGKYGYALAYTSVIIIFLDFGLGPLLTREGAKDETQLQGYVNRVLMLKFLLIGIVVPCALALMLLFHVLFENVNALDVLLVAIALLVITTDTLTFTLTSIFRALRRLQYEAIGIVLYQCTILLAGLYVLRAGFGVTFLMIALLIGSVVQLVFMGIMIVRKTKVRFRPTWNARQFRPLLVAAVPFAIAGLAFRLNGTIDTQMLKILAGDRYTGWYQLAFKLTFALTVLPGAFATSYFPAMSAAFTHTKEHLHVLFERGLVYMLLLALPITGGVLVLGDNIILSVWGKDWEASTQVLRIFMIGLPFVFLNYPVGNFLNAIGRQTLNTANMIIAFLVNVVLNWTLIPYYTFNGAAVAVTVSSILLLILGIPWVYWAQPFSFQFLLLKAGRIAAAAGIMTFVVYMIQDHYPLPILLLLGVMIFGATVFILGGITRQDLKELLHK